MRRIRLARETDVPRLVEVARQSFLSAFAPLAPVALIEQWRQVDREPAWYRRDWPHMLVLEENDVVVGIVQPQDDEINGLWIHPQQQGTGAGTLLLAAGEAVIAQRGYDRSWLFCSALNPRAYEFYLRRGYAETARKRVLHACGVEEESIRMERQLARPTSGSEKGMARE